MRKIYKCIPHRYILVSKIELWCLALWTDNSWFYHVFTKSQAVKNVNGNDNHVLSLLSIVTYQQG